MSETDSRSIETRLARLNGHRAGAVYLTGLSGSGKSTIAGAAQGALLDLSVRAVILDGDAMRKGLCAGLGFSREDRRENLRRITEAARLVVAGGNIALVAAIAPYREDRNSARKAFAADRFLEVFVDAPLSLCRQRDTKGLYALATDGLMTDMTGLQSPYEAPPSPDLRIDTTDAAVERSTDALIAAIRNAGWL